MWLLRNGKGSFAEVPRPENHDGEAYHDVTHVRMISLSTVHVCVCICQHPFLMTSQFADASYNQVRRFSRSHE